MKKLLFALVAFAAIAVSCVREEEFAAPSQPAAPEIEGVEYSFSAVTTKTVADGLSTKWVAGDQMNVFAAPANGTYASQGAFAIDEAGLADNTFTGIVTLADADAYDWVAVYPYKEANADLSALNLTIAAAEAALAAEPALAGENIPLIGATADVAKNDPLAVTMNHLASGIAFKIVNDDDEALAVSEITITFPAAVAGTFTVNASDLDAIAYTAAEDAAATITLSAAEAVSIAAGADATFYAAIAPVTVADGDKIEYAINGEAGEIVASGALQFKPGYIKTVTVHNEADVPEEPAEETNFTTESADWQDLEFAKVDVEKEGNVYRMNKFLGSTMNLVLTVKEDNSIAVDVEGGWKYDYSGSKFMYFTNWSTYLPVTTANGIDIVFCGLYYDSGSYYDPDEDCFILKFQLSRNTALGVGKAGTTVTFKLNLKDSSDTPPAEEPNFTTESANWQDLKFAKVDVEKDGNVYRMNKFLGSTMNLVLTVNENNSIAVDVEGGWKYNNSSLSFMYFTNWSTYLPVTTSNGIDVVFCGLYYDSDSYYDPEEDCFILKFQLSRNTALGVGKAGTNVIYKLSLKDSSAAPEPAEEPNFFTQPEAWQDLQFAKVDIVKTDNVYRMDSFLGSTMNLVLTVKEDNSISVDVEGGWKYDYSGSKFMYFTNWKTYLPVTTANGIDVVFCGLYYDSGSYYSAEENCLVLKFQISRNTALGVGSAGTTVTCKLYLED